MTEFPANSRHADNATCPLDFRFPVSAETAERPRQCHKSSAGDITGAQSMEDRFTESAAVPPPVWTNLGGTNVAGEQHGQCVRTA